MADQTSAIPTRIRGTRISQVLADARNGKLDTVDGPTPSLDSPTRPKTPAGFDEKMAHSSLLIHNQKAKAASRTRSLLNSAYNSRNIRLESIENSRPSPPLNRKEPVTEVRSSATLAKIPDCSFNAEALSEELDFIEHSANGRDGQVSAKDLSGPFTALTNFVASLKSDSYIDDVTRGEVEDALVKISNFPIKLFYSDCAAATEVLAVVRLNLRLLLAMLRISARGGQFHMGTLSCVLRQCAEVLMRLCQQNVSYNHSTGTKELRFSTISPQVNGSGRGGGTREAGTVAAVASQEDMYEELEDGDIEFEDEDGRYVPQQASTNRRSATASMDSGMGVSVSASTAVEGNCDLTGAQDLLLPLLDVVWEAIVYQITQLSSTVADDQDGAQVALDYLFLAAAYMVTILNLVSTDNAKDCKRLDRAEALVTVQRGLMLYADKAVRRFVLRVEDNPCGGNNNSNRYQECLVALLSLLRNFSIDCKDRVLRAEFGFTSLLCKLLKIYQKHSRVVVNCARVLAKLSLSREARDQLNASPANISSLVDAVVYEASRMGAPVDEHSVEERWPGNFTWAILTRICYTLGNQTTTNASNRALIGRTLGLTAPLVELLQACAVSLERIASERGSEGSDSEDEDDSASEDEGKADRSFDDDGVNHRDGGTGGGEGGAGEEGAVERGNSERELMDATIKMVRLLANLSIDPETGTALGSRATVLQMLSSLLNSSLSGDSTSYEELLLNVIAACTNITYYSSQFMNKSGAASGTVRSLEATSQQIVARLLEHCLHHANGEIVLEATRVLGNLTRTETLRSEVLLLGVDEVLVKLLKSADLEITAAATGVLVNLSADGRASVQEALWRPTLDLLRAFFWTLHRVGLQYVELSVLICQVLANMLRSPAATAAIVGQESTRERTRRKLLELIDDAGAAHADETDAKTRETIGSFVSVANTVVQLLQAS